jgi:hypothetical protein
MASTPLCIQAANWINHVTNTLSMIPHSMTCFYIRCLLRKFLFFHQKVIHDVQSWRPTEWTRDQSTCLFGPGRRQRTYCCIWRGYNRLLDRNQVSISEVPKGPKSRRMPPGRRDPRNTRMKEVHPIPTTPISWYYSSTYCRILIKSDNDFAKGSEDLEEFEDF